MDLEVTVHRIGGVDGYERKFGPQVVQVAHSEVESVCVYAAMNSNLWVRLEFAGWTPAGDGWVACALQLEEMNGYPLGRRPAMVYDGPCDIPMHAMFQPRHPDTGAFVVALRRADQ
jgi:hypothetical protein